jgi:hypothetical protein
MKLVLERMDFRKDGIFGELQNERGEMLFVTLEHSFDGEPALPPGEYRCVREFSEKFKCELYELKDVPGHTEIKFHEGNYGDESSGCILLGTGLGHKNDGGWMITDSRRAMKEFMKMLDSDEEFILKVEAQ